MSRFKRIKVSIDDLLLDPNNPRLIREFDHDSSIPDKDFEKHQAKLLNLFDPTGKKPTADGFLNTNDLYEGMRLQGFVPGNLIAVRKVRGSEKYVVVEGNRRTSTAKYILKEEREDPDAKELNPNVKASFQTVTVKVIEDGPDQQEQIENVLITRHIRPQMSWKPYESALYILEKYLELSREDEGPITKQTFIRNSPRIADTAECCSKTKKYVEEALRTVMVYHQIKEERGNKEIRPDDYSLVKRLINSALRGDYFKWDEATFKLHDESCAKLETVCQFGRRQDKSKILKDDKAVPKLVELYEYTACGNETLETQARRYLTQVENAALPLDDAVDYMRQRVKSCEFVNLLEAHLDRREKLAGGDEAPLAYNKFANMGADLMALEELTKNTDALEWLEFFKPNE